MTRPADRPRRPGPRRGAACALALALLGGVWFTASVAQGSAPTAGLARPPAKPVVPEQGVRWRELRPDQQSVLRPLEREWPTIGAAHKDKWIELSRNFAKRSPDDQARIQARMAEWARLTPLERSQARLHFQEAKQLPATDRKARWDEYQALPPEKKKQLAERARPGSPRGESPEVKPNLVANSGDAASPRVVAPTVVQARPGATTTLITKRPTPPSHQRTGLPKIAATPEFVNKATLLPQRGPQGAATHAAAVPTSGPSAAQ